MDVDAFEHHLSSPQGEGSLPAGGFTATAGGASCCDQISLGLAVDAGRVSDTGFQARGCPSASAAASAAVTLARGAPLLSAARIGAREIAAELGGLSPGKLHAAELAADALARALGAAARSAAAPPWPAEGRTLVAMSGGVDSAVAALLCRQGSPTVAVTLELWADEENDAERSCCSASAVRQARALAHAMDLPHFTIDLRGEFRRGVVDKFIAGYARGETPNPCVGCNGHVRIDAMIELADRLGCQWLATGHYARLAEPEHERGPLLQLAADPGKDQTYMLAALAPSSLGRMQFPLGELTKHAVRELAIAEGLPVASKPDSQDLCFLAGTDRGRFLARHGGIEERVGDIVDRHGRVLGRHRGQHHFTVGQRRGLRIDGSGPLYVLDKSAASNQVVVGSRRELMRHHVRLRGVSLHRPSSRIDHVKLRYRSRALPARLSEDLPPGSHRGAAIELRDPAEMGAPGQLACLLDGELVVGWGTIAREQ